jgi:hypothetical protein
MLFNWRFIRRIYWPTKLTRQKTSSVHKCYIVTTYVCSRSGVGWGGVGWEKGTRISVVLGEQYLKWFRNILSSYSCRLYNVDDRLVIKWKIFGRNVALPNWRSTLWFSKENRRKLIQYKLLLLYFCRPQRRYRRWIPTSLEGTCCAYIKIGLEGIWKSESCIRQNTW